MDQHDQTSSNPVRRAAVTLPTDLIANRTWDVVSLQQLRSVLTEILTALKETLRNDHGKAAECLQRAGSMLESVEPTEAAVPGAGRQGLAPWQARRVMAHIDANLDGPIRNKDLAIAARLSEFHFNVVFRNSFGQPPHAYIMRRRVERAQGLMLSTDKALCEIAAECGLADQAHLTRLFRRTVGESPGAWRRARANPRP
jgi:AraC family transcriptional regulator